LRMLDDAEQIAESGAAVDHLWPEPASLSED
jgi:hypothetical protein